MKINDIIMEQQPLTHGTVQKLGGHSFTWDSQRNVWISKQTGKAAVGLLNQNLTTKALGKKPGVISKAKDAMLDRIGGKEYATRLDPKASFARKAFAGVGAGIANWADKKTPSHKAAQAAQQTSQVQVSHNEILAKIVPKVKRKIEQGKITDSTQLGTWLAKNTPEIWKNTTDKSKLINSIMAAI